MPKILDLGKTVYQLCKEDPQIAEILKELGFDQITNAVSLNTVGRFMTIPKGSVMKNINMEKIKDEFIKRGYQVKE